MSKSTQKLLSICNILITSRSEIEEFMEGEISRAPKDPELLAHRLRNNTAASPRDAGGDLDANWEDVTKADRNCRWR